MAVGPKHWSLTAGDNASSDSNINWAEGQLPPTVNNSARAMMAAIKAFVNSIGGAVAYGGSSNAYTITNDSVGAWTSYTAPSIITLKANHTNSGAATVNVDGLGAKSITTADGGALIAGDIVSGGLYTLIYDGTNFQVTNTLAGGSFQPLDATLTGIAALAGSSGEVLRWTGTDTFTLDTTTTFGRSLWDDTDAATARTTLGLSALATTTPGTGVATFLATPSSANLRSAITDESGSGALLFANGALGTPASGTLTNCTGLPAAGVSGLGSLATLSSINNGNWSGTDLSVANGGTGASTLTGLLQGNGTSAITGGATINNGNWSGTDLSVANGGTGASDASGARTNLGLGSLATASSINNGNWSGTDLAVANGGTGASDAGDARTNLGIGSMATRSLTISTSDPSGGSDGDVWFKYTA